MGTWGLVNSGLLWMLGLVAVPVVIHYLFRRRVRRLAWAAMTFLKQAERETRRRVRLEQWLLLALRCAAVALIVGVCLRPFVRPGLVARLLGRQSGVERLVLLDDSASLAYRSGLRSDFDTLKQACVGLLEWLASRGAGDRLTLVLTSHPQQPVVRGAVIDARLVDDLRRRLATLRPSARRGRPAAGLRALLAGRAERSEAAPPAVVYVLSDFQSNQWLAGEGGGPLEVLQRAASDVRVRLIATGSRPRPNVAVVGMSWQRPHTITALPARLDIEIANYTDEPLHDLSIQLETSHGTLAPVTLDALEPGARRAVTAEVAFARSGPAVVTARIDAADGLDWDDVHRIAVDVRDALRVLLIDGAPGGQPQDDEVFYLRNALAPAGPFSSGIDVTVTGVSAAGAADLSRFDCVVLCNPPPTISGAWRERLVAFCRAGGGLVIFLGDNADQPRRCNESLGVGSDGLLPAELVKIVTAPADSPATIVVSSPNHPLMTLLSQGGESLHFWRYVRCRLVADGGRDAWPQVLARFADDGEGGPAWVADRLGQGRRLLFTSSADRDWNDWPVSPDGSYVVTMLELVQYVARRTGLAASVSAGDRLRLAVPADAYLPEALFAGPDGEVLGPAEAGPDAGTETVELVGPPAERPGVFTARLRSREGTEASVPLVVNLDPRESDLRTAAGRALNAYLAGMDCEYIPVGTQQWGSDVPLRHELWPFLLTAAVVVLMTEQFLAWWFGRTPAASRRSREVLS